MPMEKVSRGEPIGKAEFHRRLRQWIDTTHDNHIGDPDAPGVTPWVIVAADDRCFRLHADTAREGVIEYLGLVSVYGDELEWSIVPNRDGKENAVAYGPTKARLKYFYLYWEA